jgi:hypothetical protein
MATKEGQRTNNRIGSDGTRILSLGRAWSAVLIAATGLALLPSPVAAQPSDADVSVEGQAQVGEEDEGKSFNMTFAPLGVIVGGLRLTLSVAPGASVVSIDASALYVAPLLFPAHAVGGEVRLTFWTSGDAYDGFFLGPFAQVTRTFPADSLLSTADGLYGVTTVTPGLYLGYRWLWDGGFNLGLGGGAGYAFMVEHEALPDCPSGYTCSTENIGGGFSWFFLFDLGYAA